MSVTTRMMTSLRSLKNDATRAPRSPICEIAKPKITANRMICSMLPSLIACIGFVGTILISTSDRLGASFAVYSNALPARLALPGWIITAAKIAIVSAMAVVNK